MNRRPTRRTDPDTYPTTVDLEDLEGVAKYDCEPAEKAIMYGDSACAGSDARVDLTAFVVQGVDILPLLDARQRGRIEDEIAEHLAEEAASRRYDAAEMAREDR